MSSLRYFEFVPIDTLFFRDGRPFNQGEGSSGVSQGQFPPSPTTVVGALRAALARTKGWDQGPWSAELRTVLGDGDNLAGLTFKGPYLRRDGELLFPAPLNLMHGEDTEGNAVYQLLKPASEPVLTDLGSVRLPTATDLPPGAKPMENVFLTATDLSKVLTGDLTNLQPISPNELWNPEPRTGIQRDRSSRSTGDNALYFTNHVRLIDGVSLVLGVSGLPGDWQVESGTATALGGEGRAAWLSELAEPGRLPTAGANQYGSYCVTFITPGRIDTEVTPGASIPGLPGAVVSACLGRTVKIGGWNTEQNVSKPLTPHVPAGSTIFMQADDSESQRITDLHGHTIGIQSEWGYGQVLVSNWRNS